MKILIVSLTLPPENSATANLIGKLIVQMQGQGCRVDGLTLKNELSDKDVDEVGGMTVYYADYIKSSPKNDRSFKSMWLYIRKRIEQRMPNYWRKGVYHELGTRALVKALYKFKLNDYDAILCPCAYYDAVEAVLRYKKSSGIGSKVALHQVDPLTDNEAYPKKQYRARKAYEKMLYDTCEVVFTTPIIYEKCDEHGFAKERAIPVEFPLICMPISKRKMDIPERSEDEIRCVFAGYLYPTIRDAKYTMELFSRFSDPRIKLYVLGSGQETLLNEYENGSLRGRLIRLGVVPSEISEAWMDDADVLVNIGNSVTNQVPSKIFDYISRGKTILNTCKSDRCPTLNYTKDYPPTINVMEDRSLTDEDVELIEKAILENYRVRIPFSQIKEQYISCTPEYIAKQILEALK